MKVALDAQLAIGTATGIGEYVRGLAPALRAAGVDVVELAEPALDPWRFDRRLLWEQFLLGRRAARSGAALLHCASGTMPLRRSLPTIVTVHDVAWSRVQQHAPWYAQRYFGSVALAQYARADLVIADSDFSKRELLAVQPSVDPARVHVVAPGVDRAFGLRERRPDGRTLLVAGTVEPRKNLTFAIELLARLPGARIVSVGPSTPYLDACRARARSLGVDGRIEFLGYVERDRLLDLYATAAAAVVPSTYEGFGYAVAQALCAGLPCVASDRASLPEVAAGDAHVVALDDVPAWVEALRAVLAGERDAFAADVRSAACARFSWTVVARAVAGLYARVAGASVHG